MRTEFTDRIELQDVMLKYAADIDEQHDVLLRCCFAHDLVAPGFRRTAIRGIDAWMKFLLLWGTYNTGMVRENGTWLIRHHEPAVTRSVNR